MTQFSGEFRRTLGAAVIDLVYTVRCARQHGSDANQLINCDHSTTPTQPKSQGPFHVGRNVYCIRVLRVCCRVYLRCACVRACHRIRVQLIEFCGSNAPIKRFTAICCTTSRHNLRAQAFVFLCAHCCGSFLLFKSLNVPADMRRCAVL